MQSSGFLSQKRNDPVLPSLCVSTAGELAIYSTGENRGIIADSSIIIIIIIINIFKVLRVDDMQVKQAGGRKGETQRAVFTAESSDALLCILTLHT